MDIILVRHGESEANIAKIFGGSEVKLSELGKEQALKSKDFIQGLKFDKVYTSPFVRAIETMKHLGLEGEIKEEIREIGFGILENKSYDMISKSHPVEAKRWADDPIYSAVPGGETIIEGYKRVEKVLNEFIKKDEDVLLVCHEGVIKMALSFVFDNPEYFFRFQADNLSVNIISINEGHKFISKMNRVAY